MSEYEPHGPQRPRLSDEEFEDELDAREYEPTTALVKRSKGKSRGAKWIKNKREQMREEQQLAQFYLVTTTDKKKRAIIKRFADALTEESDEAIAAREVLCDRALCDLVARIVADPCLLGDIETALDSVGDAERGRRTSAPEVAGLIDALLNDTDLQDLVRAAVEVESGFAKVLGAAIGDEMLRRAVPALKSNPVLLNLSVYAAAHPKLLGALAKAVAVPAKRELLLLIEAASEAEQRVIAAALGNAELLHLFAAAYRASGKTLPAIRVAIQDPDAPGIGLKVKNLQGLSRWTVDHVLKFGRTRSSTRMAH